MATIGGESEGCGNIFSITSTHEVKSLQNNDTTSLSSASLTQKATIGSCEEKGQSMDSWFSTWLAEKERESKDTCTFWHTCGNPSQQQMELAKAEFERRIQVESEMGVVPVLVATGVDAAWLDRAEYPGVKVFFKDGNLFITVPDEVHSDVHSEAHGDLFIQFRAQGLEYLMKPSIKKVTLYGAGIRTNPDILVKANWPWDIHDGRSRVMIEIEDAHRSVKATRAHGYAFLTASEYHRAFISIKIFRYAHDFGVAVVMWNKGPIGVPAPLGTELVAPAGAVVAVPPHVPVAPYVVPIPPGPPPHYLQAAAPLVGGAASPIVFHAAFDCGTVNLHYEEIRLQELLWLESCPMFLVFLLGWALPPPAPGPSPAPWLLHIPHYDVVYKIRDTVGNLVAFPPPTHDFVLDLACIVRAAQVAMQ